MKTIKIDYDGFWFTDKENNYFTRLLKKRFNVIIDEQGADYVFCSVHEPDYNRKAVKIFYTAENVCPDFNRFDYAIGFYYLTFADRYIRWPWYRLYEDVYHKVLNKPIGQAEELLKTKTGFCSFVYSNARQAHPIREKFFQELSKYKQIDSGGGQLNNIGYRVPNKFEFISKYKFNIAFENSSSPGYTTEKLLEAMAANTMPIYWGNSMVHREFNPNSFISIQNDQDIEKAIEQIIELDQNDDLYLEKFKQPWATPENTHPTEDELLDFLEHIFTQPIEQARRTHDYGFNFNVLDPSSIEKELKRKRHKKIKHNLFFIKYPRKLLRKIQKKDYQGKLPT